MARRRVGFGRVVEDHLAPRGVRRPGGPPRERLLRARCRGGGLLRRPGARVGGPPCRQVGPRAQDLQQGAGAPGDRGPDAVVPQDFAAKLNWDRVRFWDAEGQPLESPGDLAGRPAKVRVELRQVWLMSPQCGLLLCYRSPTSSCARPRRYRRSAPSEAAGRYRKGEAAGRSPALPDSVRPPRQGASYSSRRIRLWEGSFHN